MKHPDFFIVGAPKTGTTALSEYLREHPQIFMCPLKEPDWFSQPTHERYRKVNSLDEYLDLFNSAGDEHRAVGEASVSYLNSEVALSGIREFAPEARIVAMVRNPIDLVYSSHSQNVFAFIETEKDIEKAWALQTDREAGRNIPERAPDKRFLLYKQVGCLGAQLERLFTIFPREQTHIIVFDDFKADTRGVYEKLLSFLEVPSDNRTDFTPHNENKVHKYEAIGKIITRPSNKIMRPIRKLQRTVGLENGTGIIRLLQRLNSTERRRPPMRPEFRNALAAEFAEDVALLEQFLKRDLSHWLSMPEGSASTTA